jgi:hypothetical protein
MDVRHNEGEVNIEGNEFWIQPKIDLLGTYIRNRKTHRE